MKQGGVGGANTKTGLVFENKVDIRQLLLAIEGYSIEEHPKKIGTNVLFEGKIVARLLRKYEFYRFLKEKNITWQDYLSAKLVPDDALLVIVRETLFIIEVKSQQGTGSVDEKLQTCDFKRKKYLKLVHPLGLKVEYVYVLNEWFSKPRYKDVLEYIHSVGCHYKFNYLPLSWLGLPEPNKEEGNIL